MNPNQFSNDPGLDIILIAAAVVCLSVVVAWMFVRMRIIIRDIQELQAKPRNACLYDPNDVRIPSKSGGHKARSLSDLFGPEGK